MSDWKTWSPFQSEQTRRICAHMTEEEGRRAAVRGAFFGLLISSAAFSCVFLVFNRSIGSPTQYALSALLVILVIAFIPLWQASTRRFLCSTEWARAQGLMPDDLTLFEFRGTIRGRFQFSIWQLLIATLVLSIALALLVGMPDWLASAAIGIGTILTLATLAAVIVYGRDDARAFCIGAIFPVSLIAVTVGCLFVIFAIDTVPRGTTRSLSTLSEFSHGMRFSLVVGGLMALAAGRLAVFVRRRYARPAEGPVRLDGDD